MAPYVYVENDTPVEVPTEAQYWGYAHNINGLTILQDDEAAATGRPGPVQRGMHPDKVLADLTDKAVEVVRQAARRVGSAEGPDDAANDDKPFFLYFPLTAPHTPVAPSPDFVGRSGTGDQYLDFVLEVDHTVGRVMDAVRESGIEENTLVVFTSDNGPERFMQLRKDRIGHFSAGQFRGCKRDNWDGGHRVPFVAQWPARIPAGSVSDEVVSLVDVFATVAAITGAEFDEAA